MTYLTWGNFIRDNLTWDILLWDNVQIAGTKYAKC